MVDKLLLVALCIFSVASRGAMAHKFDVRDAEHMRGHFRKPVDIDKLSAQDMLFHYFRVHDTEGDNRLDGCELLQTLLHFHAEFSVNTGTPIKIFTDDELSEMVDAILDTDDKNMDGFIDYQEFLTGKMSKGF